MLALIAGNFRDEVRGFAVVDSVGVARYVVAGLCEFILDVRGCGGESGLLAEGARPD